jgi:Tfp pilus assembly protein PilV
MRVSSRSRIGPRRRERNASRTAACCRGSVLIEVLVALVLLAVSGTALITLLGQTSHAMRSTVASERLARAASDQLGGLAIATRSDLFAAAGRRSINGWTVSVAVAGPNLFDVSIAESDSSAPLLRTTVYRPDTSDAHP